MKNKQIHMKDNDIRNEKIEIIKLYYQDYEYRNKTFWEILFKSIFVIVALIGLPYFLVQKNFLTEILIIFPITSIIICIFSMILLMSEAVRMQAVKKTLTRILESLSSEYSEIRIKEFSSIPLWRIKVTYQILVLYFLLIGLSVFALILISIGRFN